MFEVGDWVKIKENAYRIPHQHLDFVSEMNKYCGKEYQIRSKEAMSYGGFQWIEYKLENVTASMKEINGDGYWYFVEEWLEPFDNINIDIKEDDFEAVLCLK